MVRSKRCNHFLLLIFPFSFIFTPRCAIIYAGSERMKVIGIIFRTIISTVSFVFLIWFILPTVIMRVINPGNLLGVFICLCLIFRFTFKSAYIRLKERLYSKRITNIIFRVILSCWAIFGVYAVVISALMCYSMLPYPSETSNPTVIVLGAQVKPWGPSAILRQRIDAAQKYLDSKKNVNAILSGGQGKDEPVSEARSMRDNLKEGDDRLYLEDKSTNTRENIRFSKKIIEQNDLDPSAAIITDSYHQFRARMIANKEGFSTAKGIYSINTENTAQGLILYPTFFVREWIAIPSEVLINK